MHLDGMRMRQFLLSCLFLLGGLPLNAFMTGESYAELELIADTAEVAPGQSFNLAVKFKMEPEWHIYAKNPGASGLPPEFEWQLPDGLELGEIEWPAPHRYPLEGLMSYGYGDVATFIFPVQAPADWEPGSEMVIGLEVDYLICKDICLPGDASLALRLAVASEPGEKANADIFERARAAQPLSEHPFEIYPVDLDEETLTIKIEGAELPEALYFYADELDLVDPNAEQEFKVSQDGRSATFALSLDHGFAGADLMEITGVLQSPEHSWRISIPLAEEGSATVDASEAAADEAALDSPGLEQRLLDLGLVGWLVLAFVGGLILNVMPCVLPVLSIKVFSLLNHSGRGRGHALVQGLAYTLGVVASFVLLAAVLFSLRALGESIGWGFQLQNPGFVVVLGLVFFLFGLNLLGVYEVGTGLVGADAKVAGRKDFFGSFGVGVLAAVVGAPCVGPFVGGVSGIALQVDALTGLGIFAMLGFGMASPFLLLAIFPKLVAYLPKPGPWMETFKHAMGFLLMAALVFLLYLLGELAGPTSITAMLVVLLIAAVAAWVYGRWGAPSKGAKTRRNAKLVVALLLVFSLVWGLRAVGAAYDAAIAEPTSEVAEGAAWARWNQEAVDQAIAEGHPVFVDFTATWCLICQANKRTALRTEATRQLFEEHGVVSLEADWTRRDPDITAKLEEFGRSGVPLYLLYGPDGDVSVLPQNLTNGIVREAVERL